MEISKEIKLHMGHCVTSQRDEYGTPGKCSQGLHGHTYFVIATIEGNVVEENERNGGMIIDYSDFKKIMMKVIYEPHDHACMLWEKDPGVEAFKLFRTSPGKNPDKHIITPYVPTAENICKEWFKNLYLELMKELKVRLVKLEVKETPTSSAIYTLNDFNEIKEKL